MQTWRTEPPGRSVTGRQGVTTIKARPTMYNGIQMRSRLEADYAAYLDRRGMDWEYEPECFASAQGQWLPDFSYTSATDGSPDVLIEVKPAAGLRKYEPGSDEFVEHVDTILRQMTIAWASRPDAVLRLEFWEYGGPAYLCIYAFCGYRWWARTAGTDLDLPWLGMGQLEAIPGDGQPSNALASGSTRHFPTLKEAWPTIVGDDLAVHTRPGKNKGREFTIYADSAAWATQTRLMRHRLCQSLNEFFQADLVQKVKVKSLGHVDGADG